MSQRTDIATISEILNNAPSEFQDKIPDIEQKIFKDISVLLKDLKTNQNGQIQTSIENLRIINQIKSKLGNIVVSKDYKKLVNDFVENIPQISNFQKSLDGIPTDTQKMMNAVAKAQIDNTLESLIGNGYKQSVVNQLYNILLTNVTTGGSYSDMTEQLRNQLITTEDSPGLLSRYSKTYVTDTLGQFAGQGNSMIADALGSDWFQYVGSNIKTTREFCLHLTKKRYVHKSEIPTLLAGEIDGHQCKLNPSNDLPLGMKDDTTPENFIVNRGGWNCGHELIPVNEVTVPKSIRDNFKFASRTGESSEISDYVRKNSNEEIFNQLKSKDNNLLSLKILENAKGDKGKTDGNGNIYLSKNEFELFHNAVDKLINGNAEEITSNEAGATLTYWHESVHNLSTKSLILAKFTDIQRQEMEISTEYVAIKTLPDFYKKFNAEIPIKINKSSFYQTMVDNYQKAVSKLSELGGNNEEVVLSILKNHIKNGELEDQRTGLIDALYGAKINGKLIDRRKLGILIDYAMRFADFQFTRYMNKLLGISD